MKVVLAIAFLVLAAYGVFLGALYLGQRDMIYFPPAEYLSPAEIGLDAFQEIELHTTEGLNITAWWSPPIDDKPVVMFFHGNGSAVYGSREIFSLLVREGYGVWAVSYPGYPGASGSAGQTSIVYAAIEQYDWLESILTKGHAIVFYGTSLGAAIAAQVLAKRQPDLFIAESPFYSALSLSKQRFPFVPVSILLKDTYRSDLALQQYSGILVWLHGKRDEVIPVEQGQALFDSYTGNKSFTLINDANHNDVWIKGGSSAVLHALEAL